MHDTESRLLGLWLAVAIPGFIFVQYLRVFRPVLPFGDLLFIHASTNATDDHKYSPFPSQILTVPEFWYHLAHSCSCENVPFDFERAF